MEYKHLSLEWKADEEGQIEGYGSVYGNTDLGGDIVAAGAFTDSLGNGRKIKMLSQHDPFAVIGVWDEVADDGKGLRVKGRILTTIQAGREAYELVKAGAMDGLSIGYKTIRTKAVNGARLIEKADLWEVSLVTFPMNDLTRIDAVKAADLSERELERMLTRDAGLSRSVAQRLMAGGYDAVKAMRDAGDDGVQELASLLKARAIL
jgi:HK97 family phage prohead protease